MVLRKCHLLLLLLCCMWAHLYAQGPDSLNVRITRVAIDSVSIRGRTAAFPYPVLTFMTVSDSAGNHVDGLASQISWLGPNDIADNGVPISQIWQPREYHTSDPSQPGSQNLFRENPRANFREISDTPPFLPSSTMLVLDESGSIRPQALLDSSWAGAQTFIRGMRSVDRAGVIGFANANNATGIRSLGFTSDTTTLNTFIADTVSDRRGTALYLALTIAIDSTINENALRRSIIVMTDGADTQSPASLNADTIIARANRADLTIHTIALLGGTDPPDTLSLQRIAAATGGFYRQTRDGFGFRDIYDDLSQVTNNFYVMSHTSPSPCGDEIVAVDNRRTVDVTVTDNNRSGNATGQYAFNGTRRNYDLLIAKSASQQMVTVGDTFSFNVDIENIGTQTAFSINLVDSIPGFLNVSAFNPQPDSSSLSNDLYYWGIDSIPSGGTATISYDAVLTAAIPDSTTQLVSASSVTSACDDNISNNLATTTIFIAFPVAQADIAVGQRAVTDSFAVAIPVDTTWFAIEGEQYPYFITVSNIDTVAAQDVVVRDIIPNFVTVSNISGGGILAADTISWTLDSLEAMSSATFTFDATVASSIPFNNLPLINLASAAASNEDSTKLNNNTVTDTVLAVITVAPGDSLSDISILQSVQTDSIAVQGSDTTWLAVPGEIYSYTITVRNQENVIAEDVLVTDVLPDSVIADEASFQPANGILAGDSIRWDLGDLGPFATRTLQFDATVTATIPFNNFPLINSASAAASNEDPTKLDNNLTVDTVFVAVAQLPGDTLTDVSVTLSVQTAAFEIQGSDTSWLVEPGETYSYTISVRNEENVRAEDVIVTNFLPALVSGEENSFQPASGILDGDSIRWDLGDLSPFAVRIIRFDATVAAQLPMGSNALINTAFVAASNEDPAKLANNSATNTVFNNNADPGDLFRQCCEVFYLDVNVFEPENQQPLGINFEVDSRRPVKINLLDISGYRIRTLYNEIFDPGLNRREWNGLMEDGQQVGSGTYVITMQCDSGVTCWKKVIIRR